MDAKKLQKLTDEYGRLKAEEKLLKTAIDEIGKQLKENIEEGVEIVGRNYKAKLSTRVDTVYSPDLVKTKLRTNDKFMRVIKVSVTDVKKLLSPADLEDCVASQKEVKALSVKGV